MSTSNGQIANATTFNNAYVSRTVDTDTSGKVDLKNVAAPSGAQVTNAQREINSLNSFTGRPSGSAHDADPSWTNNDVGVSTDDLKTRLDLITQRFNAALGHDHSAAPGQGAPIDGDNVSTPLRGFVQQGTNIVGATGGSSDVSAQFILKEPSSGSTVEGIPVTAPYNKCLIRLSSSYDPIEDFYGNQVYGRLTNSGGVGGTWTLTFFIDLVGIETAHTLAGSNNISFWYQELFNPLGSARPVYSEDFFYPSDNIVADMPDASTSYAGKVSTGIQTFGGEKNFNAGIATDKSDVATAATIAALVNSGSFVRFTGATATELQGIVSPASVKNKRLLLHNSSSADITIKHQDLSALAIDRIITPGGNDITVASDSSIELIYETAQSRWVVVSAGTGSSLVGYPEDLGTGDGVNDTFGPLTFIPQNENSIWVFLDTRWVSPSEWSLIGTDIVFEPGFIPATAQSVSVHYLTNGVAAIPVLPSNSFQSYEHLVTVGEAAAKQITLSPAPASPTSVVVFVKGLAGPEWFGDGYTIVGSVLDWNGYSLDGILVSGDKIRFIYVT